jgi:dolichyl-phosphate beta-glucosyltransferase
MTEVERSPTPELLVSIVIPAYNEERRLFSTLRAWIDFLARQAYSSEIIVVDDGSTDGTSEVVLEQAQQWPHLRLHRQAPNGGKGLAVKTGVLLSQGAYVFYVDADLNVAPEHLTVALQWLEGGYDVVVGMRSLSDYGRSERSLSRVTAGALFQIVRRVVTLPSIRDTQCGFKGFSRAAALEIFPQLTVSSFAFDVEVLFLARKYHCRMKEMPVTIVYRAGSTVKWRRHLLPALADIVRVRENDLRGRYRAPRPKA